MGIALATLVACERPPTTKTDYQMWLERHPQDGEAHWQLADLLLRERDYQGAEHHFRKALSIRPQTADAYGLGWGISPINRDYTSRPKATSATPYRWMTSTWVRCAAWPVWL